jgi:hypothetical protein
VTSLIKQFTERSLTHKEGFDHLFYSQVENEKIPTLTGCLPKGISETSELPVPLRINRVAQKYFKALKGNIEKINRMFDSTTLEGRVNGSRHFMKIRKIYAKQIFLQAVKPQIEVILKNHGEIRSFDEVITIFGFNRLFMRELGSAGTDVDFFMLIDTNNDELVHDIHQFMKKETATMLSFMGIDMETADYLMIKKDQYLEKLSATRKSLFTLANAGSVDFIAGSFENLKQAFTFTDEQLADHFVTLLTKNGLIKEDMNPESIKLNILSKIVLSLEERIKAQRLLKQMASCELYIGKAPYKGKKTIQTELQKISLEQRNDRTATVSIKFNFNRIADIYLAAEVDPSHEILSNEQVKSLEKLSMVLSNIKCRIDDETISPLLKVQENYSDLTFDDIRKMSINDRRVVSEILEIFGLFLDPLSHDFPESCYDAFWALSDQMKEVAISLENEIYKQAQEFIS